MAFFNIMAYDLTNRADAQTGHHTSVSASLAAVQRYLDWGYPGAQLNLGFALYAKHFRTAGGAVCATAAAGGGGVGCAMETAQTADGADTQTSGWLTFEWKNLVDQSTVSAGGCGLDIALQSYSMCAGSYCCSRENYCGVGVLYCGAGCQPAFSGGQCAENLDLRASFAQARRNAVRNETVGAVSYWDKSSRVSWTWETVGMITRKFDEIVAKKGLGGVFAWNLGQDTFDWAHLLHIHNEAVRIAGNTSSATSQVGTIQTSPVLTEAAAQTSHTTPAAESARKS